MLTLLIDFLVAILVAVGASFLSLRLAHRFNLIDHPGTTEHKKHEQPTPLAGGMVIVLSLIFTIILRPAWLESKFFGVFAAAAIVFIFGLWDDAMRLPFWAKLIGQALAGVALVASGISVHILKVPGLEWVNWGITLFWVIGIVNGCNFVDSYDGLAIGIVMTMLSSLLIGTLAAGQQDLAQLISILLGIVIVLYFFNTSPARLFLGDSGAQLLGFFTAVLAILFTPKDTFSTITWFAPILITGIPIFDTTLVVVSRIRRRKHFYQAGLDHTWHRLVAMGLANHQAVTLIHLVSVVLGCLALLTLVLPVLYGILIFVGTLGIGVLLILFFDWRKRWA